MRLVTWSSSALRGRRPQLRVEASAQHLLNACPVSQREPPNCTRQSGRLPAEIEDYLSKPGSNRLGPLARRRFGDRLWRRLCRLKKRTSETNPVLSQNVVLWWNRIHPSQLFSTPSLMLEPQLSFAAKRANDGNPLSRPKSSIACAIK